MNKQINLKDIRINNNSSDYFVSYNKDNEQLRKEFADLQKQVRKLEEAHIKTMPDVNTKLVVKTVSPLRYDGASNTKIKDQEVLGFKVEEANTESGYKVKRVMSINYETRTITIE